MFEKMYYVLKVRALRIFECFTMFKKILTKNHAPISGPHEIASFSILNSNTLSLVF